MTMRCHLLWVFAVSLLVSIPCAMADRDEHHGHGDKVVVINNYGAPTFVYGGSSYVPLRSAAEFVGAALLWDSVHDRATITYNGREVGLVIGSRAVSYRGREEYLPVAPVVVRGQVLVPVTAFSLYLGVPIEWDEHEGRVFMQGRPGWGYYRVAPRPPRHVIRVIERHGPPAWAPAHGYRRKQEARYEPRGHGGRVVVVPGHGDRHGSRAVESPKRGRVSERRVKEKAPRGHGRQEARQSQGGGHGREKRGGGGRGHGKKSGD